MTAPTDNGSGALRSAADLIETNGLHKWDGWPGAFRGYGWKSGIPLCALSALAMAMGKSAPGDIAKTPALTALIAYVTGNPNAYAGFSVGGNRYFEISAWSDKPTTTQSDVVDAMRKVADEMDAANTAATVVAQPVAVDEQSAAEIVPVEAEATT